MITSRLADLRIAKGLSKKDVALGMNLPYSTYLSYENGEREPGHDTLVMMAKFYGVMTDFLLGVSDDAVAPDKMGIAEILTESFRALNKRFCEELHFKDGEFNEDVIMTLEDMIVRFGNYLRNFEKKE